MQVKRTQPERTTGWITSLQKQATLSILYTTKQSATPVGKESPRSQLLEFSRIRIVTNSINCREPYQYNPLTMCMESPMETIEELKFETRGWWDKRETARAIYTRQFFMCAIGNHSCCPKLNDCRIETEFSINAYANYRMRCPFRKYVQNCNIRILFLYLITETMNYRKLYCNWLRQRITETCYRMKSAPLLEK